MMAEVQGGQAAVDIINLLRTNNAGLPQEIDGSAWPLPQFASTNAAEIAQAVLDERLRELWMHAVEGGDKLRNGCRSRSWRSHRTRTSVSEGRTGNERETVDLRVRA
jgi:hypothetical protein